MARKAAIKKEKLLAFARKQKQKNRYRVNPEGELDDRLTDNSKQEYKKQAQKEFNFLYNGPPIKIKRGFEKLT